MKNKYQFFSEMGLKNVIMEPTLHCLVQNWNIS
jgi:hypothetical protein